MVFRPSLFVRMIRPEIEGEPGELKVSTTTASASAAVLATEEFVLTGSETAAGDATTAAHAQPISRGPPMAHESREPFMDQTHKRTHAARSMKHICADENKSEQQWLRTELQAVMQEIAIIKRLAQQQPAARQPAQQNYCSFGFGRPNMTAPT